MASGADLRMYTMTHDTMTCMLQPFVICSRYPNHPTHWIAYAHLDEEQRLLKTRKGAEVDRRQTADRHGTNAVEQGVNV